MEHVNNFIRVNINFRDGTGFPLLVDINNKVEYLAKQIEAEVSFCNLSHDFGLLKNDSSEASGKKDGVGAEKDKETGAVIEPVETDLAPSRTSVVNDRRPPPIGAAGSFTKKLSRLGSYKQGSPTGKSPGGPHSKRASTKPEHAIEIPKVIEVYHLMDVGDIAINFNSKIGSVLRFGDDIYPITSLDGTKQTLFLIVF